MVWLSSCGGSFICNNMCQGSMSIKKEKAFPTLCLYSFHLFKIGDKQKWWCHHHTVLSWKGFLAHHLHSVVSTAFNVAWLCVLFKFSWKILNFWEWLFWIERLKGKQTILCFVVIFRNDGTKEFFKILCLFGECYFYLESFFDTQCCSLHFLNILLTLALGSWK